MLPRWHVIYGAIFSLFLWYLSPNINLVYIALVFLSSVFIDLDHYFWAVLRNKRVSLFEAFEYHKKQGKDLLAKEKKGLKPKSDFHFFHTIEFHLIVAILGIFFSAFFYIFIGMVFHSMLDLISGAKMGKLHRREFFFFNWLREKF